LGARRQGDVVSAFRREDLPKAPRLDRALTQDDFVKKARERIWAMLHAKNVVSVKLESLQGGAGVDELNAMFGEGNWLEHRGRLYYKLDNAEAQIAAAREVLSRAEPQLNRTDPNMSRTFKVFRLDPSKHGDAVGVEEIASSEIRPAELPAGSTLDVEAEGS